jgi:hypothetical protein
VSHLSGSQVPGFAGGLAHSARFRKGSTRYARRIAEAYRDILERAAANSDEEVATTVAAWKRAQDLEPVDWQAVGAERDEEPPAA